MIPPRGPPPLLPAPPQVHPGDTQSVLEEFPDNFGVVLWKTLRAVDLWAQTPAGARKGLVREGGADRRWEGLGAVPNPPPSASLVRRLLGHLGRRGNVASTEVADLCLRISEWAEGERALATATAFAEAAALVLPRASAPALAAGRLLKWRGLYARAEIWLHRSLPLGIATKDWLNAARSWSEIGTVFALRGNMPSAEASHIRALKLATRRGLQQYVGVALHDLCGLYIQMGDAVRTQKYARLAIRAYYPGHPRLPIFASDLAYFWMLQGAFECSLQVFLAVMPLMTVHRERLFVAANLIRAAGGAGQRDVLEAHWEDTLEGIRACRSSHGQAEALLDMARGAASLGDWKRAEDAASEAVRKAVELGEGKTVIEGDAVLDSVRRHGTLPGAERPGRSRTARSCITMANALSALLEENATAL